MYDWSHDEDSAPTSFKVVVAIVFISMILTFIPFIICSFSKSSDQQQINKSQGSFLSQDSTLYFDLPRDYSDHDRIGMSVICIEESKYILTYSKRYIEGDDYFQIEPLLIPNTNKIKPCK